MTGVHVFFRVSVFLLLASAVFLSGYFRTKAAQHGTIRRSEEGKGALIARMLVAMPLLLMILAYVVSPDLLQWARVPLPLEVRSAGLITGLVALLGCGWTLLSIGANISPTVLTREGQHLVMKGPYRWVRHPLYSSSLLLLISIGVMAENLLILGWVGMGILLLLVLVIPREEQELVGRFGKEYEQYRRRTGAVLPRVRLS